MSEVMLASSMSALASTPADALRLVEGNPRFAAELKLDGIRAVITRAVGDFVRITNRRGDDITHRYPDVVEQMLDATDSPCILDGEIVVVLEGRIDFAAAHRRDAQDSGFKALKLSKQLPATFIAFDIQLIGLTPVTSMTNQERRDILEQSLSGVPLVPRTENITALWNQVVAQDMEGIVIKDVNSRYTPGRSRSWVKIKRTHRVSVLVAEGDEGSGHRSATFGALRMQLLDADTGALVDIGRVGSGFTDQAVRDVAAALADPSQLPLVCEVEYLEVAPTGQLRMPVFRGVRSDITRAECTTAQLRTARPL